MELIDYIDNYIWLVDEAITVYGSYKVINYGMQNLSYIQDLQDKIQRGHVINIERELIKDFPDAAILKRRLDFLEMKLDGHLIEFEEGEGNDFLGDSFEREKFFIEKLGEKDGVEYALRLHFILSWLNDDRIRLLNMIDRLRCMDKKNDKSNNILLPAELDTDEAKSLFQEIKYCVQDGFLYSWTGTSSLFGYFVDIVSDTLNVRPSNGHIPWKIFKIAFQRSDSDIATAKQAVNDYRNKGLSEPEGFLDIKKACKKFCK